jgi:dCMP deaminase
VHAEANAIVFAAKEGITTNGADIYTTTVPCLNCARLIANAGIRQLFYAEGYRESSGLEFLENRIIVKQVSCP